MSKWIAEAQERCEKADRLICNLASGKAKWTMSVPPRQDDTDMALIETIRTDLPRALSLLKAAAPMMEMLRRMHHGLDKADGCPTCNALHAWDEAAEELKPSPEAPR